MKFEDKVATCMAWLLLLALDKQAEAAGKAWLTRIRSRLMDKIVSQHILEK